jgi:hypothetical protein
MQHWNRPSKYLKRNSQVRAKFQAHFNPTYRSGGKNGRMGLCTCSVINTSEDCTVRGVNFI